MGDIFKKKKHEKQLQTIDDHAIGLLYGTFVIFGLAIGLFLGYSGGRNLISSTIGCLIGTLIGIAFGLFSNAIFLIFNKKSGKNKENAASKKL